MIMGLRELPIKYCYTGKGEKILNEFLLPALSVSKKYDRITSFYTVQSLLAISQGVEDLYRCGGSMRLIIGVHSFPAEFVEAALMNSYLQEQVRKVREDIKQSIATLTDVLQKKRLATIAWMMEDGLMEVKAVATKEAGIFHAKTLIFTDDNNDKVVAIGSPNETDYGLGGNVEQVMVVKSWDCPEAVNDSQKFFCDLWENKQEDTFVFDITEDTADMILQALGPEYTNPKQKMKGRKSTDVISESAMMPANFFVSGDIPALYMHQERAVLDALSRWPVRVLFSDEVGLGKTFEAAATLVYLVKYCGVKRVIILTPKSVLQQWQDELYEHFGLKVWLYNSGRKEYLSPDGATKAMYSRNPVGVSSPNMILMSAQYARGSGRGGSIFDREDAVLPDLLIVDEAHSARVTEDISGNKKKTRMYRILEKVSQKIPHLILATATPMQKTAEEYHAILKLLGLPKTWKKERLYRRSLKLISSSEKPDISDAASAADMVYSTVTTMSPSIERLQKDEIEIIENLMTNYKGYDNYDKADCVLENWNAFRRLFIKQHPARLLTVRNTRRSLSAVGYVFPKRNLYEKNLVNSDRIQLFYSKVFRYISEDFFSIERALEPDRKLNTGFVRVSYQQRVASSLYSCIESLKRRLARALELRDYLAKHGVVDGSNLFDFDLDRVMDDMDSDEEMLSGVDDQDIFPDHKEADISELRRAVSIECTSLSSLVIEAEQLLNAGGDLKILKSIELAVECLEKKDAVLVFSRYTDTIDALLQEFARRKEDSKYVYGIYTGKQSVIVKNGQKEACDKNTIKSELFAGRLKIVFCSDAASEGLNLQAARVLINVDVPWTPSRLEQRIGRIARLGQTAKEVDVYNVWYPNSIEARMYHRIQRRLEETNLAIGEFPEVVANSIKKAVLEDSDADDAGIRELRDIRNSYQTKALEELWASEELNITTSKAVRLQMMEMCDKHFPWAIDGDNTLIHRYTMEDGKIINLTAEEGMEESVSYKSTIWENWKISIPNLILREDYEDNTAAFALQNNPDTIIKHEHILDIVANGLREEYISSDRPKMLCDPKDLDLSYAVECEIHDIPEFWPLKEN